MSLILGKMALVLAELAVLLGGLSLLERSGRLHPELLRKLLHVAMGLTVLSFPWLFDRSWPVVALACLAAGALLSLRLLPALQLCAGSVISGVERASLGELYFPAAIAVLWVLSGGDPLLFGVPVVVLTLADATAALIGVRYGTLRYQTHDGHKSAEGSIAFFAVAFLSVHVPVLLATDTGRLESLLLAMIVGLLVMLLESVAWRGLDNLLAPLGTYAFLTLYLDASAEALAWRSAAVVALVTFALLWRRRSSMDDSALIAASLFGYAALLLGGWIWVLPPLIVFLSHGIAWPRGPAPRMHSVEAVLSVTGVGMACLLLQARWPWAGWLWIYTASFSAHLAIVGVSYLLYDPPRSRRSRVGRLLAAGAMGWGLVFAPVAVFASPDVGLQALGLIGLILAATTSLAACAFHRCMPWLYEKTPASERVHVTGAALGALAAGLAAAAFAAPIL